MHQMQLNTKCKTELDLLGQGFDPMKQNWILYEMTKPELGYVVKYNPNQCLTKGRDTA